MLLTARLTRKDAARWPCRFGTCTAFHMRSVLSSLFCFSPRDYQPHILSTLNESSNMNEGHETCIVMIIMTGPGRASGLNECFPIFIQKCFCFDLEKRKKGETPARREDEEGFSSPAVGTRCLGCRSSAPPQGAD